MLKRSIRYLLRIIFAIVVALSVWLNLQSQEGSIGATYLLYFAFPPLIILQGLFFSLELGRGVAVNWYGLDNIYSYASLILWSGFGYWFWFRFISRLKYKILEIFK